MKKVRKGSKGYISYQKKRTLLITLILFAVPLIIFFTGIFMTKTRLNLFTVVAILGCLPACKSLVALIMIMMQKSMAESDYQQIRAAAGDLSAGYEMAMTTYDHTYPVQAVVVCGAQVCCYVPDEKGDLPALEKHITKILAANGYTLVHVKAMKDPKSYLQRVKDLEKRQEHYREEIIFEPDSRYPGVSGEDLILHVLYAISL